METTQNTLSCLILTSQITVFQNCYQTLIHQKQQVQMNYNQKELAPNISSILCSFFIKSLETGVVPTDWRAVHASPIYKKRYKYSPENYRAISLTCICCTILEYVVVSAIMTQADNHNILYPLQHGFRKKQIM